MRSFDGNIFSFNGNKRHNMSLFFMLLSYELHMISKWSLLTVSQNCGLTLLKECGSQSSFQVTVKKNVKVGLNIILTYEKERLLLQKDKRTGNYRFQNMFIDASASL